MAMKLPNWFRIAWWALILAALTVYLYSRWPALSIGQASAADVVVFLVWIALWLLPLVAELSVLGITLKSQIEVVRRELSDELASLRAEIRNSVDVTTQVNPQISIPAPSPDALLPEIELQVRRAVEAAMRSHGVSPPTDDTINARVDEDVSYLFSVRYSIERELRRIYAGRYPDDTRRRYSSVTAISRVLSNTDVLDAGLGEAIREVYRACSAAVHGEDITQGQVNFVRDVAPELLSVLRSIG